MKVEITEMYGARGQRGGRGTKGPRPREVRRALMAERDAALAAGNIPEYQRLTTAIAALPLAGVPPLTDADLAAYHGKVWP